AYACVQSRRTENLHRGAGGGNRTLTLLLRADFGSGRASRLTFGVRLTLASTKSAPNQPTCIVVPGEGIEPSLCCQNWILSPARLPIPPSRRFEREAWREAGFARARWSRHYRVKRRHATDV